MDCPEQILAPDGEVLAPDGAVLAIGWCSTGFWMVKYWLPDGSIFWPELLPEEFETVLRKNKTIGWLCRQN